jgi:hypothetical protein
MPTAYENALNSVAEKKHALVHQFQFKKLEKSGGLQWWNVRNLRTGADQKINDSGRLYATLRDITNNKLIWADTLQEQNEMEKEANFLAYQADENARQEKHRVRSAIANGGSDHVAGSAPHAADAPLDSALAEPEKVASSKAHRKINREFNLCQQQAIFTEVVFGTHNNKKGEKISPFKRNEHGNNGHFFDSVVAALNAQADGPFKDARAVKDTVKLFVETAVNSRKKYLEEKYGENYMKRNDWDVYDYSSEGEDDVSTSEQINAIRSSKQKRAIEEMLDALVYCAFDAEYGSKQPPPPSAYSDADDEILAKTANGAFASNKRQRPQHLETMRPRTHSAVAQIASKQEDLTSMMQSIASMLAVPTLSAAPVSMQSSPVTQAPEFDEELTPLLDALKKLAPGTTIVCRTLAMSLGNYGILSVEELREMEDAPKILKDLNWTPLQIQKVLTPVPRNPN